LPAEKIEDNKTLIGSDNTDKSHTEQVTDFHDEVTPQMLDFSSSCDPTFTSDNAPDADLGSFLSRPVKVATVNYDILTALNSAYDIWYLYLNHSVIKNKIENYKYLKADLHLKFIINASPFYYGCVLANYRPLKDRTFDAGANSAIHNAIRTQRPHTYIYPSTNQGSEMKIPFFYPKNYLDITSASDVQNMGELRLDALVQLRTASTSTTNLDIQVYAWLENVTLLMPTVKAALQSGEDLVDFDFSYVKPQGDEYEEDGPVSGPASAVASVASKLENVPYIGAFARSTNMIASSVANVAKYFGFTKTPVIDSVSPYKDLPFHSFSSTEIGQPTEKLSLDPKNELVVDPRVCGLSGLDEMNLNVLCKKEAMYTVMAWTTAAGANTQIGQINAGPTMPIINGTNFVLPPVSHFAHMFKYWRGSLIFRFKIICSQYHRGRLQIFFDPAVSSSVDPSAQYNEIIDITSDVDVEIVVPYVKETPWTTVNKNVLTPQYVESAGPITADPDNSLGVLSLVVNTPLTAPVTTADAFIMCYIRAGDDFELGDPDEIDQSITYFPQSGYNLVDFDYSKFLPQSNNVFGYDKPRSLLIFKGSTTTHPETFGVCMGEKVTSVRALLRRATLTLTRKITSNTSAALAVEHTLMSRYPLCGGFDTNGIHDKTVSGKYNYVYNHPFNMTTTCYVGSRGSMEWHFDAIVPDTPITQRVERDVTTTLTQGGYASLTSIDNTTSSRAAHGAVTGGYKSGWSGMSVLPQRTQTGCSVNVPYYSKYRFRNNTAANRTLGLAADGSDQDAMRYDLTIFPTDTVFNANSIVNMYFNIGEDFSCVFFLSTPELRKEAIPAAY